MAKKETKASKAAAAKDEKKEPAAKKETPVIQEEVKDQNVGDLNDVGSTISSSEGKGTSEEKESLKTKEIESSEKEVSEGSKDSLGMNYEQAEKEMDRGMFVKLPEWGGFWFKEANSKKVLVLTKDGELLDTPHEEYKSREDWSVAYPTEEQVALLDSYRKKVEKNEDQEKVSEDNKKQAEKVSSLKAVLYNRHRGMSFQKLSKKISLEDLQSKKNLPLDSGRTSEFIMDNGLVFSLERGLTKENRDYLLKTTK